MIEGKALICTIEDAWDALFKGYDQRIFWIFIGGVAYLFQLHLHIMTFSLILFLNVISNLQKSPLSDIALVKWYNISIL